MKNYRWILIVLILFIGMITIPYILALLSAGDGYVFSGFLYNPQDGNSYLAKMYQGWEGNWRFVLPYTAEAGEGAYLFLFYILLGHIARVCGLSPILIFHLVRVLCSIGMAAAIFQLLKKYQDHFQEIKIEKIYALILLGSGMGWVFIASGLTTSDFLIAEAYPFLSAFSNPHFPLGIALIIWSLERWDEINYKKQFVLFILGVLIAIIMPFGVVILSAIGGMKIVWEWFCYKKLLWQPVILNVIGGGIFLIYQFVAIQTDPVLSEWNKQNITSTPAVWDLMVSFSPVLLSCILGAVYLILCRKIDRQDIQERKFQHLEISIIWVLITILLIFFPFNLQRRFLTGIYVPLAVISAGVISSLKNVLWKNRIWNTILCLSIITNLLIIMMMVFGIMAKMNFIIIRVGRRKHFNGSGRIRKKTP